LLADARRRFVALAEADARVAHPLQLIRRLYRIEELADVKRLEPEERVRLVERAHACPRRRPSLEGSVAK